LKHITTLEEYCRNINIAKPRYPFFDIRSFEDNMKTVKRKVEPFRHEFYAIALRLQGEGTTQTGQFTREHGQEHTLFFNSPYQTISWDIALNWKGYYIIFTEDFIRRNPLGINLVADFPFLRLDQSIPLTLDEEEVVILDIAFKKINKEYHSENEDKFQLIHAYTYLLLLYVKRSFNRHTVQLPSQTKENRTADIKLLSRFQTLIETSFYEAGKKSDAHNVAAYARSLSVHPNYLNAVVKRITGKTAKQLIHDYIMTMAKSLLTTTDLSVKEIAFRLLFDEPTHFTAFFKKLQRQTPNQFRGRQL
jgi:AraC family transcriptional regulator, transcriptional activator of pobA